MAARAGTLQARSGGGAGRDAWWHPRPAACSVLGTVVRDVMADAAHAPCPVPSYARYIATMEEGLLTQRHPGSINDGASNWKRTRDLSGPAYTDLPSEKLSPPRTRLQSLDAVRGLNVMLMIFVDNVGRAGGFEEWVYHSPWDTIHLADFVMPLFLFMVGVSLSFSMKKYSGPGITRKIFSRTAKLLFFDLITQGGNIFRQLDGSPGPGIDMQNLRICGILQRIAWAYCVVALMKLLLPVWTVNGFRRPYTGSFADAPAGRGRLFCHYGMHWFVAFAFFGAYLAVMLLAHVPSWSFEVDGRNFTQACDVRVSRQPSPCSPFFQSASAARMSAGRPDAGLLRHAAL